MAFTPRTFEQIRDDMWNYVKIQTGLTDFEIGAVIRTVIEAASLEDDEQYFQMVQLLDAFSWQTAQGSDLDDRVADFNLKRLLPNASAGQVVFEDLLLAHSELAFSTLVGATSLILTDSSQLPTAGFPYALRIGEGTVAVEDVTVSANNLLTNTLTCTATTNPHSIGDFTSFVSGTADKVIASSQQVQVPSIGGAAPVKFVTTESATIVNGNFYSTPANAKAVTPGATGNVGVGQIVAFSSSPPFNGAGVVNFKAFAGGRDTETDQELRDRARGQIQSLSKGTVLALKQAILGVSDAVTGQRVVTANLLEDFLENEVIVYIDDGTGFTPNTVSLADSDLSLTPIPNPGAGSFTVVSAAAFPATGWVIVSPSSITDIELLPFSAVNYGTNVITLATPTTRQHFISDEIVLVDLIEPGAQPGETFLQAQNFPIVRNSQRLWVDNGAGFQLLGDGVDYFINRATGQIELVNPLVSGARAAMDYTYYTGLVKTAQTVIDGSVADPVNFPGYRAAGVIVVVETPIIHRVTVRVSLTAQSGFVEANLATQVKTAIENYISSLGIGDDVIRSKIIDVAMNVTGVYNAIVVTPASDVVILQNELPIPFDTSGNSLVTVT
jgi:uncharacterized phage protein gp47/JayE